MRTLFIIIIIIALIIGFKFLFLQKKDSGMPTTQSGASTKKPIVKVDGFVVQASKLDNVIFATGSVLANESVELHSEVSGIIKSLSFKEGMNVEKNQLLVKINDADLQAQLSKLVADLAVAKQKEQRTKQLLEKEGASQEEYDDAVNTVASINSDINYSKALIAKTEVRAPFSGVVGLRNVSEGSFLNPLTVIADLQQLNPVKIEFSIPDNYSGKINTGDEIRFTVSGSSEEFTGKVFAIEPQVDANTRTLRMRALCVNEKQKLLPGSFARIQLIMQTTNDALMIPTQSIVPVLKGKQVFVSHDGIADAVKIETGVRNDTSIEIISGLQKGDTVITSGLMQLKPGTGVSFISVK